MPKDNWLHSRVVFVAGSAWVPLAGQAAEEAPKLLWWWGTECVPPLKIPDERRNKIYGWGTIPHAVPN